MQAYSTLKELAEGNNFPVPRVVKAFREETTVNGHRVRNGIDDEGNTTWWLELVAAPNPNREYGERIRAEGVARRAAQALSLEDAKALFTEKGVAAVDVAKLTPEDKTAFLEWRALGSAPLAETGLEAESEPKAEPEPPASEITKAWLTAIDGIGSKGADSILEKLAEDGITTFEAFAQIQDLTKLPAIGKGNGENLRARLTEVAGEPDPIHQIREDLMVPISSLLADDETALAYAEGLVFSGEYDDKIRNPNRCSFELLSESVADRCRDIARQEALFDINCPHCNELFDTAPAGLYESGDAHCLADDDDDGARGNCGKTFWLVTTPDGYTTHKTDPAEDAELPILTCPKCGSTGPDMDGFGLLVCPRDPQCYCTHPAIDYGKCTICGYVEAPESLPDGGAQVASPEPAQDALSLFGAPQKIAALVPVGERIHPALSGCKLFAKTETHSDAWHKARAAGVGSSDAGAILGLSPYSKAADIWKSKLGEEQKRKPWLDDYAQFGTWFESYLREFCETEHGIEIIDGADIGTLQSIEWPKALANIDGLDITHGVVEEYKTTTEKWTTIPAHYEAQVQHQMFVCGVNEVRLRQFVSPIDRKLVPSLLKEMRELDLSTPEYQSADRRLANWLLEHGEVHTWIVERDQRYIDRMIAREKAFWTFVEMEIEPVEADPEGTVDLSDDPDALLACTEYARLDEVYQACSMAFLSAEGIDAPKRGSINGAAEKALKAAKSKARKAIEKAVALTCDAGDRPKRLTIGGHKATFVDKGTHAYWNLYAGEADSVDF